ncbi:hypothetical protein D9756_000019 [Leucocoprinus leucothites]|uniref:Peptidase M20 dimerisation domain-containing protein n=1 Tax=Leucocoprinus leucothites TaxID=201217 RepID=A0A8H5LN88_9AGAR|nr:hypothetical protein D9756_000019 [Leucoagaricus leucothites]
MSMTDRYLIETSKALTVFNGGVKANTLPEHANATVNTRIEIFSTHEQMKNTYLDVAKSVAQQYSLLLNGKAYSNEELIGNITVGWSPMPRKPSPISPSTLSDPAWEVLSKANQATFGSSIVTTPSLLTGNTDTRHYWNLCVVSPLSKVSTDKSQYTLNLSMDASAKWHKRQYACLRLNIHTVDEKILINTHVDGVRFYTGTRLSLGANAAVDIELTVVFLPGEADSEA